MTPSDQSVEAVLVQAADADLGCPAWCPPRERRELT